MGSLSRAGSAPWAALPLGAKLFRIAHFVWGGFNMAALGYVWFSAATRRRDRCLSASVGLLGSEGVALVVGRGNCPFGPFQRSLGDPVPMFELMLPPRAAKAAVPALAVVTLLGFVAAWLRPPAPASSVSADARPGDRQPHYSLPR